MKSHLLLLGLIFLTASPVFARSGQTIAGDTAYTRVLTIRSQKIVDRLDISDTAKARLIRNIIMQQYRDLNEVQHSRDSTLKAVKMQKGSLSTDALNVQVNMIREAAQIQLEEFHRAYLAELLAELTPGQVITVKDAMTYNVLPITYKAYLDMLPDLTGRQKTQIMAYLIEAREYAMDGGTSEEKHAWFGKYKGRINNYLSKQGYNMNEAQKDWAKRRAATRNKNSPDKNK